MDESPEALSPEPETGPETTVAPRPHMSKKIKGFFTFIALVIVLSVANYEIKLPYYVLSPGDALPVKNYVQIPAQNIKPQSGKILLATVALQQADPIGWVLAHITPGAEIDSKKEILGPKTTQSQYTQENQEAMDDSQQTAITVALTRAGFSVTQLGDGGQVAAVAPNAPATGKLSVNDVITAVNGQKAETADQVVALTRTLKPGDTVHLQVQNSQKQTREVILTTASRPDNPQQAYIGISLETADPHLQTPFPVSFKQTNIGGPSAGLAFTLTLIDELTPGQLTGGQTVATTGTINPDGTVGEVGGVKQKVHAVESAGAKIFLVPTSEYPDAKKEANKSLTVIPVNTVDDAIRALATHGGDASGIPNVSNNGQ